MAFLEALKLYGKNWSLVHKHIGTRSSAQTRSHAQKYFKKLERKGTQEAMSELILLTRKSSQSLRTGQQPEDSTLDSTALISYLMNKNQVVNDFSDILTSSPTL